MARATTRTPHSPLPSTRRPADESTAAGAGTHAGEQPTHVLPGIGPTVAERLRERGIDTVEDLLWLVPRRYDDVRQVMPLGQAIAEAGPLPGAAEPGPAESDAGDDLGEDSEEGEARAGGSLRVTTFGMTVACRFHRRGRKRWLDLRLAGTDDTAARLIVRWFNAHASMANQFPRGSRVVLSGRLDRRIVGAEMANPDVLSVTLPGGIVQERQGGAIIPRYSDVPGASAAILRKARAAAAASAARLVLDGVPRALSRRMGLAPLGEALQSLHAPPASLSVDEVEALNRGESSWHRRLAFEDLFILGLAVARRRRARRADRAIPCPVPADRDEALGRTLPFALTGAQRRAIDVIGGDLAKREPMSRLLQGDVGSGKTAVAFAAVHQVVRAGRQVAFMAPTELLAEQHAGTLLRWCGVEGIRAALLTASTVRKEREALTRDLAAGHIDLVIGTHALLSEGVEFAALGLVIIDEQHRFGVAQRFELRAKSAEGAPHLLVMTATPIPRTLALTAYGDLDVTTIDEMPPGRMPPRTMVLSGVGGRERAYAVVRKRLAAGERIYVVCPLIEPGSDEGPARADAVSTAERLSGVFAPARVGLVHGRMPQAEREETMARFREGSLDILVATTVIEVGVDVPEATVMVILDAHSFGLAQLHQLRGRIGRGGGESYCLLMTRGRKTPEAARRLGIMAETSDGFRIAEEDLVMRGPGELLGARQAGLPKLRFGDIREHAALLSQAREAAESLLSEDPMLTHPDHRVTRMVLDLRTRNAEVYGPESG